MDYRTFKKKVSFCCKMLFSSKCEEFLKNIKMLMRQLKLQLKNEILDI